MKIYVSCHAAHMNEARRVKKRFASRKIRTTTVPLGSAIVPFAKSRVEFHVGSIMKVALAQTEYPSTPSTRSDLHSSISDFASEAKSILEDLFPMLSVIEFVEAPAHSDRAGEIESQSLDRETQNESFQTRTAPARSDCAMNKVVPDNADLHELLEGQDEFRDDDPLDVLCAMLAEDFVDKLASGCAGQEDPEKEASGRYHSTDHCRKTLVRPITSSPGANASPTGPSEPRHVSSALDARFSLDRFVTSPSNLAAFEAASGIADRGAPAARTSLLCIQAGEGLGKTHLLHGIAWARRKASDHSGTSSTAYLTGEQFTECCRARSARAPDGDMSQWLSPALLLIDDFDILDGAEPQECFRSLVQSRVGRALATVLSCTHPPQTLHWLGSLHQAWEVVTIAPPEREAKIRILEAAVRQRQEIDSRFFVYSDALEQLIDHCGPNGRDLEAAAARLFAFWTNSGKPVTAYDLVFIASQIDQGQERETGIRDIVKILSARYGNAEREILSIPERSEPSWPTQLAIYLSNQLTALPLPEIGCHFGGINHSAVRAVIGKVQAAVSRDRALGDEIIALKSTIWDSQNRPTGVARLAPSPPRWSDAGPGAQSSVPAGQDGMRTLATDPPREPQGVPALILDHSFRWRCGTRGTHGPLEESVASGVARIVETEIFEGVGAVKWFDAVKGFGFIRFDDGLPDAILHVKELLAGGYGVVPEGTRVHALLRRRPKGLKVVTVLQLDTMAAGDPEGRCEQDSAGRAGKSDWERVVVKWFNRASGFGFLTRGTGTPDILCHKGVLRRAGLAGLAADQVVEVRWSRGLRGCVADEVRSIHAGRQLLGGARGSSSSD